MIKVHEFISVCLNLVKETNYIIRHISDQQIFNKINKPDENSKVDDFATDADIKSQDIIIKGLRKFWPSLKIVGEEDIEPEIPWDYDFSKINKNLLLDQFFQNQEFDINDAVVWIDPLDGTLAFLDGDLHCVTTLIGVSIKQQPVIGIIGQLFKKVDNQQIFDPKIYFSHTAQNKIYYINPEKINNTVMIPYELQRQKNDSQQLRITSSSKRLTQQAKEIIDQFNPTETLNLPGAGNKFLNIIKGNVDIYFYMNKGLKRWDTCAPEALLRTWGGISTGLNQQQYNYDIEQSHLNEFGILAALDQQKYDKIMMKWKEIHPNPNL